MAQLTAPVRSMGQRLRSHWRGIVVACGLVLILGSIALSMLNHESRQADQRYAAAVAEADRLDPGWRLDDILAGREKITDRENSALRVQAIAEKLPGGWPRLAQYNERFSFEGETPEVRLSKGRIEELRDALEVADLVVAQARVLSEYPRGQLDGVRPRFERMEQVGVNAYVDVNFPYGGELHRVIFLLWVDAKLHIEAGDVETAILDLRAMVNASRSIGDYPGITAQTSRAAGLLRAIPCVETALAQGQAGTKSLATLQALLEDEAQHPGRMIAIRGDRAMADDLMEQIDSGKLGLSAIPNFSAHPFWIKSFSNPINLRESRANLLRINTRATEIGRLPEAEQIAAMNALDDEWVEKWKRWGLLESGTRVTERLMVGKVNEVPKLLGPVEAQIRTAATALAAERFRMDQGRWPKSLDQLVPKYISAVPRDPFAKGPLKLLRLLDGLFVYSVGLDGKDDGGKIDPKLRIRVGADTGFHLWDVDRRRQAAPPPDGSRPRGSTP